MLLHNSVMRTKTCISYKDVGPIGCPAFKESCFIPELQYTFETVMWLVQEAVFLQSMKYPDPSTASCVLLKKCSLHFKYFKWSVFLKLYSIPSRRLYSRTIYNMLGNKNIHTAFLHSVPWKMKRLLTHHNIPSKQDIRGSTIFLKHEKTVNTFFWKM